MMNFHQHNPANDPLAAALAAAAELARNGGTLLFESLSSPTVPTALSDSGITSSPLQAPRTASPSPFPSPSPSPSPSPIHMINSSSNSACGDQDSNDDDNNISSIENGNNLDNDATAENEEDAERRMARSRERNREHARRTRRRKKAQLEALQSKVQTLQAQNKTLKQSLEECRIASILVGFSMSDGDDRDAIIQTLLKEANEIEGKDIFKRLMGGKRARFVSDASDIANTVSSSAVPNTNVSVPLKIVINGKITLIGGDNESHLNWKSGVYTDANGVRILLTHKQLESLRRERNRMHAKMTRDRKKAFIAAIEKTIEQLESCNNRMSAVLKDVIHPPKPPTHADVMMSTAKNNVDDENRKNIYLPGVTPSSSPSMIPRVTRGNSISELMPVLPVSIYEKSTIPIILMPIKREEDDDQSMKLNPPAKKRICHGFSLSY